MVYIFIESSDNPINVQIDPIIENPQFLHLESIVMYNSWFNLKTEGAVVFKSNQNEKALTIQAGHYTKQLLKDAFDNALSIGKKPFTINLVKNEIVLTLTKAVELNKPLISLLGGKNEFNRPETLDIRCDVIEPCITIPKNNTNILNRIEVKGQPYEKQIYNFDKGCCREISTGKFLNTFMLSITDIEGNLIDFRGHKLRFTINII